MQLGCSSRCWVSKVATVESCHVHGERVELEARKYERMRVCRVVGPVEAGKRYTALRKTGGREECGTIFAPINELAPEGSINLEGKVM